jgi:hypothetical protein
MSTDLASIQWYAIKVISLRELARFWFPETSQTYFPRYRSTKLYIDFDLGRTARPHPY